MHPDSTSTCSQCGGRKAPKSKLCRSCYTRRRPPVDSDDGTSIVPLTEGYVAIIDTVDCDRVAQYTWCAQSDTHRVYARARVNGAFVRLHRFILYAPPGVDVDHINGNGLDNRRSNLRVCSHSQNMSNRARPSSNSSGYKGVSREGSRWRAYVTTDGHRMYLGTFDRPEDAARAYDNAASRLHGEFSQLNFPHSEVASQPATIVRADTPQRRGGLTRAVLTEDQVREIRRRYVFRDPVNGIAAMADEFGVCVNTIRSILNRETWKHAEP